MFSLYKLPEAEIILYALVLMRITAFLISSAVLGSPLIPANIKVLLSLALSIVMFPLVRAGSFDPVFVIENFILLTGREIIIGLTLGFLTRLFFFAVQMTGDYLALTIGLSSAQLYNPMSGTQGSAFEQFFSLLATLVFFAINGHHLLISALNESFQMIPLAEMSLKMGPFGQMAEFGQSLMLITLKMSAPVVMAILAVNLSMGILGRAVPQMNVLVTSMPITIGVGFAIVLLTLPLVVVEMQGVLDITTEHLMAVMKAL